MLLPDFYAPRTPPFQHQREALERGWDRVSYAYLLEMGLGKTRVLIDNFCLLHAAGLADGLIVVAPKSVYGNWTREDDENPGELQKWMWPEIAKTAVIHQHRAGTRGRKETTRSVTAVMDTTAPGVRILAVNVEALTSPDPYIGNLLRQFMRNHRTLMVIDESTIIKNRQAERTKVCIKLGRLASYRRILAGRGSTGSLSDFWSQFEFLAPGEALLGHRSFVTFQAQYCDLKEIYVGGRVIKTETGSKNIEQLADILRLHSYRRTKRECLDLPEKDYRRREVTATDEQLQVYRDLRRHAMAAIGDSEVTTQIVMTQLMRMHQVICGHVKTDDGRILRLKSNRMAAVEEIVECTDEQVVVWAGYRPDADLIAARLRELYGPDSVAEWHGGVAQEARERGETEFQAGRRRFMVATSAGARGRTWTAATLVIYYSNSYDLEIREQSEDRTHRIGTIGTVTYVDIVCPDTVDDKIISALRAKKDVVRAVLRDGPERWI